MKQEISTLMDGELSEDDALKVFDRLKHDPSMRKHWAAYHLVGDALRQPEHIHSDLSARIRERLRDEPIIMVPRRRAIAQKVRTVALSLAASLSAIGVVAWMTLQVSPEIAPGLVAQRVALRPADLQIPRNSDNYLMAHEEFSPSSDMNAGTLYIRNVSYGAGEDASRNNLNANKSK